MKRAAVRCLILASTVATVGLLARAEPESDDPPAVPEVATATPSSPKPLGRQSCAAAACHGNPSAPSLTAAPAEGCWQSSLTHYWAVDPHRRAYEVLESQLSIQMMKRLFPHTAETPKATADVRCLACHTNPTLATETIPVVWKSLRSEGVSCEACHGNAERWKDTHTAWTKPSRNAEIEGTGFRDLNRLPVRAETCVGCHVGAPARDGAAVRDMNHDMIAAGHPELKQDYETLLAKLPKHWFERDRGVSASDRMPPSGKQLAETANANLNDDRKARHAKGDARTPWPELTEKWGCTECHRTLGSKSK